MVALAQTPDPAQPDQSISALDSSLFYQLLLGEMSARSEEPEAGFALLLNAARKTNDAKLFRRAVQMALDVRAGDSALMAATAWTQAQPSSKEANHYVLQILLGLNRTSETAEPLKQELALAPASARAEVIWSIPAMFDRASDKALATATVKKVLMPYFSDAQLGPTAWAVVGRMAMAAGDKAGSLTAAAAGINMDARAEHPALVALALMSAEVPTAELLVQRHLPYARPEFDMAYIKALLNTKRETDAKMQLENLQRQHPQYPDTWLIQGALVMQEKKHSDAQRLLQHYLDLTNPSESDAKSTEHRRGRSQAFFSMALIAQQAKDYKLADEWLVRIDEPRELVRAQIRRAALLAQQGQLEAAIALINAQPEHSEGDAQQKRAAQVQLLRDHQQFDRARSLLQASLADQPGDPDLMYELAMLHEKMGALDDMERLLRQLMADRPTDPQAYNALGYALADRNLRLPEAKILIAQAVKLAPTDAYIRDSLAWVEFRLGNFSGALTLLQNAYKEKPDAEIAAHLGEVLWAMKHTEQAKSVWREGLELSPDNETIRDTIKRLQVAL